MRANPPARRRTFRLGGIAAGVAALALGAFMVVRPSVEYRIPIADIQAKVDERMPVSGERLGVRHIVSGVELGFADAGTATVGTRIDLSGYGRAIAFEVAGTGTPAYRDGAFYLSGVTVDRAELLRLQEKHGTLGALGRLAGKLREEGVITDAQAGAAKAKAIEIVENTLKAQLEARPIYTLDNGTAKGKLASLALRGLRVDAGGATIELDPFGALLKILLFCVLVVLAALAAAGSAIGMMGGGSGGYGGAAGKVAGLMVD